MNDSGTRGCERGIPLRLAFLALLLVVEPRPLPAQPMTFTTIAGAALGTLDGTGARARFWWPKGVAVDGAGNLYVADTYSYCIRKVDPGGVVTTLAGLAESGGSSDGTGAAARFDLPIGIAVDVGGNVFVADTANQLIRKITPFGAVTTLAGQRQSGSSDGTGSQAAFWNPYGVAVDGLGSVFVADSSNGTIRKVTSAGVVTTIAGTAGGWGSADGFRGEAQFKQPTGVAVDAAGNLFVADAGNRTIRKVTPSGVVTTLAGQAGSSGDADGTGAGARFRSPFGVAVDSLGNVYVSDSSSHTIRKVTPAGVVTTLAGQAGSAGGADGTGGEARFQLPYGVAVDRQGSLFVADYGNATIREVTPSGVVRTVAGLSVSLGVDATGSEPQFQRPRGVAVDALRNVYVADYNNHTIRKVTPAGIVSTLAGQAGVRGSTDGPGIDARFSWPSGVAVDSSGNVYVADTNNSTIRKIAASGVVTTLAGQAGSQGNADGTGSAARFNTPVGVAVDASGNVYVMDSENRAIRKVTPGGVVTTLAGGVDWGGSWSTGPFAFPTGLAVDRSGSIFVADSVGQVVRKVTPSGVVTVLAGREGNPGSADGTGTAAQFRYPEALAVDGLGNVFVADTQNHTIRKVSPAGEVTTVAGIAARLGTTDGTGSGARFNSPEGICLDDAGGVYVADSLNNTIRRGAAALPDAATIDARRGPVGVLRRLSAVPRTGVSWRWEEIRRPSGSSARLSSETAAAPTFVPDVADLYTFRLTTTDGIRTSITTVDLVAATDPSLLLLSEGNVSVRVNWRDQYSGKSGAAAAAPQGDAFGYFYFSDGANPEVFVKVLDFGADRPYLLFWSGLTDFEYTVTFTNLITGNAFSSTKPAGSAAGGADTTGLPQIRVVQWDQRTGQVAEVAPGQFLDLGEVEPSGRPSRTESVLSGRSSPESVTRTSSPAAATELPLADGRVSVSVSWWSQYSGQSGAATPLPRGPQFGYFSFSDAGNPEVIVKVLDWGEAHPYLLFAAGLTDFQYTVTYRNLRTGQTVVFTKPAGGFGGYVNGTLLGH